MGHMKLIIDNSKKEYLVFNLDELFSVYGLVTYKMS